MAEKKKYVYFFGNGKAEGSADMKGLLGGKGANLADMTSIGLPVPPGFTITTEACAFWDAHKAYPEGMREEVLENLKRLEENGGMRKLGNMKIACGQGWKGKTMEIGSGVCCSGAKHSVKGCPPSAADILAMLERL